MTDVVTEDGSVMETTLPADKVADLQAQKEPEKAAEPAKPEAQPASQTEDEPAKAKTEPEQPKTEQVEPPKREKPKPIAKLLEDRHALREENERLKADLAKLSKQPDNAATDGDIQALADELGADPAVLQKIVDAARKGFQPALPKEVQDLIAKQKQMEEQQAEETAFKTDVSRLKNTLKDELLADPKVAEKLKELAYSDEKAPDGEPYFKKPLYELYMNYVKPELEPGKQSAESTRGGSKGTGKVLDFAQIANDPQLLSEFSQNATKEQFAKFHQWQLEHEKEPLKKPGF